MPPLRYLASDDVARCGITPAEVAVAVREAFLASARGGASSAPSLRLRLPDRNFVAKGAIVHADGLAVVKWFGNVPHNARRGLAAYNPTLMVNDIDTGLALTLMDGAWVTAVRTAAISTVAAGALAPAGARTLGIVGCGRQGAAHLEAMRQQFPLQQITLHSLRQESAERLADVSRSQGLEVVVASDARTAVEGQEIVVSAVSSHARDSGFLRTEWVRDGGFVSMVDMGFGWDRETIRGFDLLVSDELDPATRRTRERLNFEGPFDADLATVLADPSLAAGDGRRALIFAGSGLADAATAALVHRRAEERGIGTLLSR